MSIMCPKGSLIKTRKASVVDDTSANREAFIDTERESAQEYVGKETT